MRRGAPRRSEQNQSLDEEIGKIPGSYQKFKAVVAEASDMVRHAGAPF